MPIKGSKVNDLIAVEKIAQWQKLKTLVLDSVSSPMRNSNLPALRSPGHHGYGPDPVFASS
jgi:hypothetical protein